MAQRGKTKKKQATGAKAAASQLGQRVYPAPPLPRQHQKRPGSEAALKPPPQFEAPAYRGSGKLEGMVALITGGDSGIGRAVAVLFAREGADVGLVYLSEEVDAKVTREAVRAEGRRALLIPGDVTDPRFCREAVAYTVKGLGKLDILVNNAAFQKHPSAVEALTNEQFDRTFKTNIYGYFYLTKAALPYLGRGSVILNTGSVTGIQGSKELLDYSARMSR